MTEKPKTCTVTLQQSPDSIMVTVLEPKVRGTLNKTEVKSVLTTFAISAISTVLTLGLYWSATVTDKWYGPFIMMTFQTALKLVEKLASGASKKVITINPEDITVKESPNGPDRTV
jgi:hypothetical protein